MSDGQTSLWLMPVVLKRWTIQMALRGIKNPNGSWETERLSELAVELKVREALMSNWFKNHPEANVMRKWSLCSAKQRTRKVVGGEKRTETQRYPEREEKEAEGCGERREAEMLRERPSLGASRIFWIARETWMNLCSCLKPHDPLWNSFSSTFKKETCEQICPSSF